MASVALLVTNFYSYFPVTAQTPFSTTLFYEFVTYSLLKALHSVFFSVTGIYDVELVNDCLYEWNVRLFK